MESFGVFAGVGGAFRVNRLKTSFGDRRVFVLFFKCFLALEGSWRGCRRYLDRFLVVVAVFTLFFLVFSGARVLLARVPAVI